MIKKIRTTETADAEIVDRQRDKAVLQEDVVSKRSDSITADYSVPAAPQANREVSSEGSRNLKQNNAMHVISGRVMNSNFEPLANASLTPSNALSQPSDNNRLNTDKAGYFNVLSPDTSLVVKVTATGYRDQLFRLRNNPSQNQLVLKPEDIKVTGYGTAKNSKKEAAAPNAQNAVPQGGWVAFEQYIEKNKIYPAEQSNLAGEVIVLFQVNNNGKPGNFKILQSLTKSYDDEAIRLIKEGPKWTVSKGRKASVTVTIRF